VSPGGLTLTAPMRRCVSRTGSTAQATSAVRGLAKVRLPDHRIGLQFLGRARCGDPALGQNVAGVSDVQGLLHVLLNQEHGHARVVYVLDDPEILLDEKRRQAKRRLVDDKQGRFPHEAASDGHHGLLAAGHGSGRLVHALAQPGEDLEHPLHAPVDHGRRGFLKGPQAQILGHAHLGEHLAALRDGGDAQADDLVGRQAGDVPAFEDDGALPGRSQPEDGPDQGGLAHAVGAQKAGDAPGRYGQAGVLNDVGLVVAHEEVGNRQDGFGHHSPPR